jgi:hypothetical protein
VSLRHNQESATAIVATPLLAVWKGKLRRSVLRCLEKVRRLTLRNPKALTGNSDGGYPAMPFFVVSTST